MRRPLSWAEKFCCGESLLWQAQRVHGHSGNTGTEWTVWHLEALIEPLSLQQVVLWVDRRGTVSQSHFLDYLPAVKLSI